MNYSVVATGNTVVSKPGIELELIKTYHGSPVICSPKCRFDYRLNFQESRGSACLSAINNVPVNIALYPLGKEGMWDFVSKMQPTLFVVNGQPIVIHRVALNIDPFTGEESAAILFNPYGSCTVSTGNFDTYCTAFTD